MQNSELFGIGIEVYAIIIVLCFPIFFFWRWIFRKKLNVSKNNSLIVSLFSTIISTPIVYLIFVIIFFLITTYYPNKGFRKTEWNQEIETRYELSKDLIQSKLLIGKSKQEVHILLGKPDCNETFDTWSYYLGYKPGGSIDPDYLDIEFKKNRVISVSQHTS